MQNIQHQTLQNMRRDNPDLFNRISQAPIIDYPYCGTDDPAPTRNKNPRSAHAVLRMHQQTDYKRSRQAH